MYDHTVKIWRLYVCFLSCFCLVKVELPVAGAAKFEIYIMWYYVFYVLKLSQQLEFYRTGHWKFKIRYLPPLWVWIELNCIFSLQNISEVDFKGKKTEKWLGIPSHWSLKIQNGMLPPLWVRIGLNCIFSLWDTSEVDFKGKKTEKWLEIPSNWSLKIQNGMLPPLWVWIGLNCIFSIWDTSEVDFKGRRLKNNFQGQPVDFQHVKNILPHTHLKFGGTSYWQLYFY